MKFSTLMLIALASTSLVGFALETHASVVGQTVEYVFTATSGTTSFNGSTVTLVGNLSGGAVLGWDLTDGTFTLNSAINSSSGDTQTGSLFSENITSVGPTTFVGTFQIDSSVADFNGTSTSLMDTIIDPPGVWTAYNGVTSSVPDASSTFEMLLAGAGLMGVCLRRFARR